MPRRAELLTDITVLDAARSLGLATAQELPAALDAYRQAGFDPPAIDPVTGRIDAVAWERFRRLRNPRLFPELTTPAPAARNAEDGFAGRLEALRNARR